MVARSWPCVTLHTLQGDIHHWIPLLDHFDAFFQQHIQGRHDLQLDYGDADQQGGSPGGAAAAQQQAAGQGGEVAADPVFPTVAVLEVLRVTTLLLEGCSNKHLYNSYEHLSLLLAAPSSDVVLATLQTLAAFVRKSSSPTTRCALPPAPALLPAPPPAVTAPHSCVERVRPPARC
jgi:E3 ubiquitin-protein ligase HUWE1